MYAILINHILAHGNVLLKYRFKKLNILLVFCQWHVSSFTLISGIVGYKTYKYSNLLYLYIIVLFYSVIFYIIFKILNFNILNDNIINYIFPVIFVRYWYFTRYFGMYILLPIINKGILYIEESELKFVVFSAIGIFILWADFMNKEKDVFLLGGGTSTLWFLVSYIIGSYIGKYKLGFYSKKYSFCIICIIIFISSGILAYYFSNNKRIGIDINIIDRIKIFFYYRNNSFTSISQAISLTLFLSQIKYNKFIEKIITFIGPFTFGIYLIHEHTLVRKYIIVNLFIKDSNNLSENLVVFLVLIRGISIFIICFIIDYLRNLIFIFLKIKTFCIFLEKKIKVIFK